MIAELKIRIDNINIVKLSLPEYLKASLDSEKDKDKLCNGWDYLRTNLTPELKEFLVGKYAEQYWGIDYNAQKVDLIIKNTKSKIDEEIKKQLGSWVYLYNDFKREAEREHERNEILSKGYTEILGTQKELDKTKVKGIFSLSKIGVLGSFNKFEEVEGKLEYSEYHKCLMIIPKGCRTRGHLIMNKAYIKKVEV